MIQFMNCLESVCHTYKQLAPQNEFEQSMRSHLRNFKISALRDAYLSWLFTSAPLVMMYKKTNSCLRVWNFVDYRGIDHSQCYVATSQGTEYDGIENVTASGHNCMSWNDDRITPHHIQ